MGVVEKAMGHKAVAAKVDPMPVHNKLSLKKKLTR